MSKYEEDVYSRAEMKFRSLDAQIGWLSSFAERKGNAYEQAALSVAEDLQIAQNVQSQIKSAKMLELERLEQQAGEISISKIRNPILREIKERKSEITGEFQRIERETEKKYKSQIEEATTIAGVQAILSNAERDTISKTFNRINSEGQRRIKEIRKEQAKELQQSQQKAREERLKQEKIEREAERKRKLEELEAKRAEENARREERQAEIAREKEREAERELREIRRIEMQLNAQEQL